MKLASMSLACVRILRICSLTLFLNPSTLISLLYFLFLQHLSSRQWDSTGKRSRKRDSRKNQVSRQKGFEEVRLELEV